MISENEMYWLTRLDGICTLLEVCCGILLIFSALLTVGMVVMRLEDDLRSGRKVFGILVVVVPAMLVCATARVFTPTTKEMAAIKVIPLVANDEDVQSLGKDVLSLSREWVEELRPKKENK